MKNYTTEKYQITIHYDPTFTEGSVDNINAYNSVYFSDSKFQPTTILGIKLFDNDILVNSVAIGSDGGTTGVYENSAIIENDRIVICCSDTIFCLSIPELHILWKTKADQATCFEIFKLNDDYLIHGELEISRLDKNGKIVWQRAGTDIFTTSDGDNNFIITDEYILVTDWENKKYKFDFNGQIIV